MYVRVALDAGCTIGELIVPLGVRIPEDPPWASEFDHTSTIKGWLFVVFCGVWALPCVTLTFTVPVAPLE